MILLYACAEPVWTDARILEGARRQADADGDGRIAATELAADRSGDGTVDDAELRGWLDEQGATWALPGWAPKGGARPPDTPPSMGWQIMETLRQEIAARDPTWPAPTREELDAYRPLRPAEGSHEVLLRLIAAADAVGVEVPPEVRALQPPPAGRDASAHRDIPMDRVPPPR